LNIAHVLDTSLLVGEPENVGDAAIGSTARTTGARG
jgi:hypothetical protein